ncbi:MAG: hypothetical protein AAF223_15855, partial [Bacteroidota bacterium]
MTTVIVLAIIALVSGALFFLSSRARPNLALGKVLMYASAFIGLFLLYVGLVIVAELSPSVAFWVVLGLSLVVGIIHTWLLHKRFAWVQKELFLTELALTLLIYAVGSALLCLLYSTLTEVESVSFLAGAAAL